MGELISQTGESKNFLQEEKGNGGAELASKCPLWKGSARPPALEGQVTSKLRRDESKEQRKGGVEGVLGRANV